MGLDPGSDKIISDPGSKGHRIPDLQHKLHVAGLLSTHPDFWGVFVGFDIELCLKHAVKLLLSE
jgi:hypothetical protein